MYGIAMCNKVNKMMNLWSFDLKNVMNTITFWKADKGNRNAGGLYRLAAGQLVTLKQETDSYFLFPQTTGGQAPGLQW